MTKHDLINVLTAHGLTRQQSASIVKSVLDLIFRSLQRGEDVRIMGFGQFRVRRRASRPGRNPQTGDPIGITARKVLTFKPSRELKQRVNPAPADADTFQR